MSVRLSLCVTICQLVSQCISQSVYQSVCQSVNQSVTQTDRQTVSQSVISLRVFHSVCLYCVLYVIFACLSLIIFDELKCSVREGSQTVTKE